MEPGAESSVDTRRWHADARVRIALAALLTLFLAFGVITGWFLSYALTRGPEVSDFTADVFIPRGTSVKRIGAILADASLIQEDFRFILLAQLTGSAGKLQAGEFSLHTSQTPLEVIRELVRAHPVEHLVTIPEGLNIHETAAIFAEQGWTEYERFLDLATSRQFLGELGLKDAASFEGYLYPDTYRFIRPAPDEKVLIEKLFNRSQEIWDSLNRSESELNMHEVFTLASIVEKETGLPAERPLIAGVFLNRLKKKMKLQSDPTVIYGIDGFQGQLKRSDLKKATPYNTYVVPALPPGPICSPGKDSLQAVLRPAETDSLYFVSKNDKSHHFSKTLNEHNRAVRKYQRK